MKWIKIRIKTTTEASDIIISSLYDIGLEGAQIEDNQPLSALEKEQMFVDVLPDRPADDGIAYLNFFIEMCGDADLLVIIGKIKIELNEIKKYIDIGEGSISILETDDLDWINNWKQYFHQFAIDDVLVVPSWETVSGQEKWAYILRIDPGTAFGTGMHETTQLCIRQLRKHIKRGDFMLDIGCGSGILAILSLMFGAKQAYGTDLDAGVLAAVKENCLANDIPMGHFKIIIGNIINNEKILKEVGGEESYDIVAANILTETLIPLTAVACRCLKKGGYFITSGIINENDPSLKAEIPKKAGQVVAAMQSTGMKIEELTYQGEWISITARKI